MALYDYGQYKKLTVDHTKIDTDLPWFPLPIPLGSSVGLTNADVTDIFTEVGSDYLKIAVFMADGSTQLYVEVEQWDATGNKGLLWVSRDTWTVASASDTEIYIAFDASAADNTAYVGTPGNRTEVWNSDFAAVYTMAQDPTGGADCIIDSSGNGNHGTPAGAMTSGDLVDGQIGKAIDFDGSDDCIELGTPFSALSVGAIKATVQVPNTSGHKPILCQTDTGSPEDKLSLGVMDDGLNYRIKISNNYSILGDSTGGSIGTASWHTLMITVEASIGTKWLIDGADATGSVTFTAGSASVDDFFDAPNTQDATTIGLDDKGTEYEEFFSGKIENFYVFNTPPSAAWIKADYHAQTDNLLTFGATTEPPPAVTTNAAANVIGTTATLHGTLDNLAGEANVDVYFDWGLNASYGNTTASQTMSSTGSFNQSISGLTPDTTYHFRAVVTDGVDTWYGDDKSFTTRTEGSGTTVPSPSWGSDYKGLGPWDFTEQQEKPEYNCGSMIAIKEDPTWTTQTFPGDPITDDHDPCGYWTKDPADRAVPEESKKIIFGGRTLAWSPDHGEQYENGNHLGRFVVGDSYPHHNYSDNCDDPSGYCPKPELAYSDDGGFTWENCTLPETELDYLRGSNKVDFMKLYYFTAKNDFLCTVWCPGSAFYGILHSSDGIEWELVMSSSAMYIGSQLLTNNDFSAWTGDNPDGWTVSGEDANNYFSEDPDGCEIASDGIGSLQMYQTVAVLAEKRYRIDVTAVDHTGGDIELTIEEGVSGDDIVPKRSMGFTGVGVKYFYFDIPESCNLIKVIVTSGGADLVCESIDLYRTSTFDHLNRVYPKSISLDGTGLYVVGAGYTSSLGTPYSAWFYGSSSHHWAKPEGNPANFNDWARDAYRSVVTSCYFRGKHFIFVENYEKAYYAERVSLNIGYYESTGVRDDEGWWNFQDDKDGDGEADFELPYDVTGRAPEARAAGFYDEENDISYRVMVYGRGHTYDGFNWYENNPAYYLKRLDVNTHWAFGSHVWAGLTSSTVLYSFNGTSWSSLGDGRGRDKQVDVVAGRDRILWTTSMWPFGDGADSSPRIQVFKFKTVTVTPGDPG